MTGTCKLCKALVFGRPVPQLGPDRAKAEFFQFAEAMRQHVFREHKEYLQTFSGLLQACATVLSSLFADCELDEFKLAQTEARAALAEQIQAAVVVVELAPPAAS